MTAINQNFEMYSGDTRFLIIPIKKEDGSLLDITGGTFKWALKKNVKSTSNIVLKTTSSGITLSNPINGEIKIKIDPADTASLSGEYYHEVEMTDVQGNVSTVTTGTATIIRDGV